MQKKDSKIWLRKIADLGLYVIHHVVLPPLGEPAGGAHPVPVPLGHVGKHQAVQGIYKKKKAELKTFIETLRNED
jgi:hypothetical protein